MMMRNAFGTARFLHMRSSLARHERFSAGFMRELTYTWKVWHDFIPI